MGGGVLPNVSQICTLFNVHSNTCELTAHGFRFLSPICLVRKGLLLRLSATLYNVSGDGKTVAQVLKSQPPDAAFSCVKMSKQRTVA